MANSTSSEAFDSLAPEQTIEEWIRSLPTDKQKRVRELIESIRSLEAKIALGKEQKARQKKLEETSIKFNETQIAFTEKQIEALKEQRGYTKAIKASSWVTGFATGIIAVATITQFAWQCSKEDKSEQQKSSAIQTPQPIAKQTPNLQTSPHSGKE